MKEEVVKKYGNSCVVAVDSSLKGQTVVVMDKETVELLLEKTKKNEDSKDRV